MPSFCLFWKDRIFIISNQNRQEILFPIPLIAQKCTHVYLIYIPVSNLIEIGSTTCMSIARDVIKKASESYYPAAPPQNTEDQPFLHRLPHQLHHMR